jgi:hypothetical protein
MHVNFFIHKAHFLLFLAVAFRFINPVTADLSYIILAGYALLGPSNVIKALAMAWLFNMLNPALVPVAYNKEIGRFVLLGAGFFVLFVNGSFTKVDRFTAFTLVLGLFFVFHSLFFSTIPDVSILKALLWLITIVTLLRAFNSLNIDQRSDLNGWLFIFLLCITLFSLIIYPVESIAFLRNNTGFQGVLSHPQVFGPTMALFASLTLGWIFKQHRPSWVSFVLAASLTILILSSESRTAFFAVVMSLGLSLFLLPLMSGMKISSAAPGLKSKRMFGILGLTFLASSFAFNQLSNVYHHFISKSDRAVGVQNLTDAYISSRSSRFDPMIENILNKPWVGIGFGLASNPDSMKISRTSFLELPISAPVEKGVLPISVLEEVGIPGFILFSIWVLWLLKLAVSGGVVPIIIACTALLLNMGESVLFSPSGLGAIVLIFLAYSATYHKTSFVEAKPLRG